jgi:hypothetical protein
VGEARILAGFVQGTLEGLDPELAGRVCARIQPASAERLQSSSRIAWLPVAIDVELTEALFAELGAARARAQLRDNLRRSFDLPVLRNLLDTAVRLLGRDPERVLRWAPQVWSQLYRDSGALRYVPIGPGDSRMELSDLPDVITRSRDWLDGTAAAISAVFDVLRTSGDVHLADVDPIARTARFEVTWKVEV